MGAVLFFCCGFKLEKDPIALTQTEVKKAPAPDEEKKVREVPVSPSFRSVGSMDRFMTKSSISTERQPVVIQKARILKPVSGVPETGPEKATGKPSEGDLLDELMLDDSESEEGSEEVSTPFRKQSSGTLPGKK